MNMIQNDEILIKNIKEKNDEYSLRELINRHAGLCFNIYKKYNNAFMASGVCVDDVVNSKDYMVYKSAISYDETKNCKFSTWLYNQIRYQCLNSINENHKYIALDDQNLNFIIEKRALEFKNNNFGEFKDYIFELLENMQDERAKQIFKMRYFEDKKNIAWAIIGKKLNISTQTAINIHNKTIDFLKKKLKSKNCFDKI